MARTFEMEPCGRCGGSGRYSYNSMHGDMCYGCSGKGRKLSKAGRAAYEAWLAIARPEIAVEDLRPGMKLRVDTMTGTAVCEVASVEPDRLNEGRLMVRFVEGSKLGGHGSFPGHTFTLAKTRESHRAAWDAMGDRPGIVEKETAE